MPAKPKTRTLTVFLLKEDVLNADSIFKRPGELEEKAVRKDGATLGNLYIQPSHDRRPEWLSLFDQSVEFDPHTVRNASTAAVWIADAQGRKFALTFGYGRNLLRPGCFEEDFGLRVTLNSVDPNKIKAIDRMTLDAIAQQTRIQATQDSAMSEFGLDVEQDLLRAVVGSPNVLGFGQRLAGRDALQITRGIGLGDVAELLGRCLTQFQNEDFRKNFPWIDQIHEIDDPEKTAQLDLELVRRLRAEELEKVWLAPPEMIEWDNLSGFKYRDAKNAPIHADIHVRSFLDELEEDAEISERLLRKRYHVCLVSNDNDAVIKQWPVYRCLYCEVQSGGDTFLLNNARWFRIATDFVDRVTEAIDTIEESGVQFPEYADKSEADYTRRVVDGSNGAFALMDQKLVGAVSLPNKVEFCDIYSVEKQIVHLKRYSASSALSHLFAQGVVSAKLFLGDHEFRRELNDLLPEPHRLVDPAAKLVPAEFEIVFGIISKSKKKLILPFFSRVNLKNAYSSLSGMGFKVSLSKIAAA